METLPLTRLSTRRGTRKNKKAQGKKRKGEEERDTERERLVKEIPAKQRGRSVLARGKRKKSATPLNKIGKTSSCLGQTIRPQGSSAVLHLTGLERGKDREKMPAETRREMGLEMNRRRQAKKRAWKRKASRGHRDARGNRQSQQGEEEDEEGFRGRRRKRRGTVGRGLFELGRLLTREKNRPSSSGQNQKTRLLPLLPPDDPEDRTREKRGNEERPPECEQIAR